MKDQELNNEVLARYAIFLASQEMEVIEDNKITNSEKALVEKQLAADPDLPEYLEFLKKHYIQIYRGLKKSDFKDITLKTKQIETPKYAKVTKFTLRFKPPLVRYPLVAFGLLLILIFSVGLISKITTPSYFAIIEHSSKNLLSLPRQERVSTLDKGKTLFNYENYSEAIKIFDREHRNLKSQKKPQEQAISAYYLGLTYFKSAKRTTFALFPRYQAAQLDSSFKYLESSRLEIEDHPHFGLDLYWYLAVVETLRYSNSKDKLNYENAKKYLNLIIQRNSKRSEAARKLLALFK